MARYTHTTVHEIFDDLEKLLNFCCEHGFKFEPRELYDPRTFVWQQYMKFTNGKPCRNNWKETRYINYGRKR